MKRCLGRLFALIFVMAAVFGCTNQTALALNAFDLTKQINDANPTYGLTASYSGNEVTVTGAGTADKTLSLNIDADVTVFWGASFTGGIKGAYLINLTGTGSFVHTNGRIENTGTGGTINASGAGMNITVRGDGLYSRDNGITLNITAHNVTLNVENGGIIDNDGQNSAVNVSAEVLGTRINIIGGKVSSMPNGYAINDGGTSTCSNNTQIIVTNGINKGTVASGGASAIRSSGSKSAVFVMNGNISNDATTNSNPTIYMNGGEGDNVFIGGDSVVKTTNVSNTSYVIQTTGNVYIQDNAQVLALAGRAINLVGKESKATINGGAVSSQSGIAISTATTDPGTVTNASVFVNGGLVSSVSGAAIQITGAQSVVEVNGGNVYSTAGHAINVTGTGIGAAVNIKEGWVYAMSASGRAINVVSTATGATVSTSGGLVFSYGKSISEVVNKSGYSSGSGGVVVAWNTISSVYTESTNTDLTISPVLTPPIKVFWHTNGIANGIYYANGANSGFFPLEVTIEFDQSSAGLVFDIDTGLFYLVTGNAPISASPIYTGQPEAWAWNHLTKTLDLKGFFWATTAPVALTIVGGDMININLEGTNSFASINNAAVSAGIKNEKDITIKGSGSLNAAAGTIMGSYGIDAGHCKIEGGTVIASGGGSAFSDATIVDTPDGYKYWLSALRDGGNADVFSSYRGAAPVYHKNAGDKYVKIQTLTEHKLTIVGFKVVGTVVGTVATGTVVEDVVEINLYAGEKTVISNTYQTQTGSVYVGQPPYLFPTECVVFASWTGVNAAAFADVNAATTSFTMPDSDSVIKANSAIANKLYISGGNILSDKGSGSTGHYLGYYLEGEIVPIGTHTAPMANTNFVGWRVSQSSKTSLNGEIYDPFINDGHNLFGDVTSVLTTFTMPGRNVIIEAPWNNIGTSSLSYELDVVDGSGSNGALSPAQRVVIAANASAEGYEFDRWIITVPTGSANKGAFINCFSPTTEFIMGAVDIQVTATYKKIGYSLLVISGKDATDGVGRAIYHTGNIAEIVADPPQPGQVFDRWIFYGEANALQDERAQKTSLTMPDHDVIVEATYKNDSSESSSDGGGGGGGGSGGPLPASVDLEAKKTVSGAGAVLKEGQFSFTVYEGDDIVTSGRNDAKGKVVFAPITYTKAGKYTCKIVENPAGDGWTADTNEYMVTVTVTSNNNVLTAEVAYAGGKIPVFENRYSPAAKDEAKPGAGAKEEQAPGGAGLIKLLNTEDHISYVTGVGHDAFEPDRNMTRAEVAQMFYNLLAEKRVEITKSFPDELPGTWHERAVHTLATHGVINGYPDGRFYPEGHITRAEFVALAVRFSEQQLNEFRVSVFTDVPTTHWAFGLINTALQYGWITGYSDGVFDPERHITRAEVVTLTNRMLGRAADREYINNHIDLEHFADLSVSHWAFYNIIEANEAHNYERIDGVEKWQGSFVSHDLYNEDSSLRSERH